MVTFLWILSSNHSSHNLAGVCNMESVKKNTLYSFVHLCATSHSCLCFCRDLQQSQHICVRSVLRILIYYCYLLLIATLSSSHDCSSCWLHHLHCFIQQSLIPIPYLVEHSAIYFQCYIAMLCCYPGTKAIIRDVQSNQAVAT